MAFSKLFKNIFKSSRVDVAVRYEIMREAISGTMSKFYKARDRETDTIVGLKVLDSQKTETFEARFKGLKKPSEGEIALLFDHPYIVKTLDMGYTTKGEPFIVMEFLDGPGLNSVIISKAPELNQHGIELIRQAGQAISAVHKAGFIHRDICPRNFVANSKINELKLIDFGLTVPASGQFLQPGNRTGTPNYMAPEVVRRRTTDQRLDIFSFGAMAYEMCALQLPWQRGVSGQAAMSHSKEDIQPLISVRPAINPKLANIIMQCIETEPENRPSSMKVVLAEIQNIKQLDHVS